MRSITETAVTPPCVTSVLFVLWPGPAPPTADIHPDHSPTSFGPPTTADHHDVAPAITINTALGSTLS